MIENVKEGYKLLVKTYKSAHTWDHWLTHFPGTCVLETEKNFLTSLLKKSTRKHGLLIGVPEQAMLLHTNTSIINTVVLSPLINHHQKNYYIESEYDKLPILPASIDLVVLPHTLELLDNPQKLLHEACRVIKPEGEIIIFGFNPISLWGLKKWWLKNKSIPWSLHFMRAHIIKKWLKLLDFELVKQDMLMFRPPLFQKKVFQKLQFLEQIGNLLNPFFGGIYVIIAKAKVIPLTPIKLRWKQKLSNLSITVPGPSMRDMQ